MNLSRIFLAILLSAVCGGALLGQKGLVKQADQLMKAEKYLDALEIYRGIEGIEKDKQILLNRGICNYYTNNVNDAISDLGRAFKAGNENKSIYLYMGKCYQAFGDYEEAAKFYKTYLVSLDDSEERYEIIDAIKRCGYANDKRHDNQLAFVENLGEAVNSVNDEVHPTYSPNNQNKFYFSSSRSGSTGGLRNSDGLRDELIGKYSTDMYAVELQDGNWTSVIAFDPLLNSPKNDLIMGFNESGSVMYFIKSPDMETGIIYTDTFYEDRSKDMFPDPMVSPIVSTLGDKDVQIYNDTTFLFASNREGGFGGYDIYLVFNGVNGWSEPMNLGPIINSAYDEDSPFLCQGGNRLFFSSNRLTSMGGYDIFSSNYGAETQVWSNPENLGIPINSPKDDQGWRMSGDGTLGIFSSNRIQSLGGYDLFLAYMKEPVSEQLFVAPSLPFGNEDDAVVIVEEENGSNILNPGIQTEPAPELPKREYVNSPVYYEQDENILNPNNNKILNDLTDLMKIYPDLQIILTSNSTKDGQPAFELYFSIKRAEKIVEYLNQKGISSSRITVRGAGSNFPIALLQSTGMQSRVGEKTNKRIDVQLLYNDNIPLKVISDEPNLKESAKSPVGKEFKRISKGLVYRVKFGQAKQMLKSPVINRFNDNIIERLPNTDDYIYTTGIFTEYNNARLRKNELVRMNITDAQVVPYLNNIMVDRATAEELVSQYPDLDNYLRFE